LHGEPDVLLVGVEYQRMRITRGLVRHHDLFDLVRCRIVATNQPVQVARVPHDPVRADDEVVRSRSGFEFHLPEFSGFGIQVRQVTGALSDEPHGSFAFSERVAWAGLLVRDFPLPDVDVLDGKRACRNE
jgi:hypothetical protein